MSHRHAPKDRPPLLQQYAQPRRPWRPPPRRHEPGSEATIEPTLHLAAMRDGTVLTFTLDDGSTIRGRVEWYDRRCVVRGARTEGLS